MTQSSDRLDRIEAILVTVAERTSALAERQDRFQTDLESMNQRQDAAQTDLRESVADTVSMIGSLSEQQAETDQRFNTLLAEARADRQQAERDRQLNESEHRAFRETFQTLLAEIARIWRRLTG